MTLPEADLNEFDTRLEHPYLSPHLVEIMFDLL
jgi:hypothetical protein